MRDRARIAYEAWCAAFDEPIPAAWDEFTPKTYIARWKAVADALDMPPLTAIHPDGTVTAANEDSARLEWILPILSLADGPTDERSMKIAGALMLGMSGRAAIDKARKA